VVVVGVLGGGGKFVFYKEKAHVRYLSESWFVFNYFCVISFSFSASSFHAETEK
jgi:hypothetical protein